MGNEQKSASVPNVRFVIDQNYLLAYVLYNTPATIGFSSKKFNHDIIELQDYAWEKSKESYLLLSGADKPAVWPGRPSSMVLNKAILGLPSYMDAIKKNQRFKKILKQTEVYMNFCRETWEKKSRLTSHAMSEITGLEFDTTYTVYITHPSMKNGLYLGDNEIAYGHNEGFKNYSVIYIWHEILHSKLPRNDVGHALLELAVDEELRVRLNTGRYPPFFGHPELRTTKLKLMPYWRRYLVSKPRNILKLYDYVSRKPGFK